MPTVKFLPVDVTVELKEGESILDAAEAHEIELDHACGGACACSTCHVIVEEGMDNLTEIEDDEDDRLDEAEDLTLRSRLACQAKVKGGHVTVTIPHHSGPVKRGH